MISKKDRKEKKMLSSKDDKHFLLSGVKSHKKIKDDEKEKEKKDKPDKGHCFWESVTMTMRQISPTKKLEKLEGWEPPCLQISNETETDESPEDKILEADTPTSFPDSLELPLELGSWAGRGFEEDSSRYANLSDSKDEMPAVRWTARAKVKLAGISKMSRGIVSESSWEGLK
uniref:Si:ch211-225h24.2 n=1 Tax=Takifugu rubripes TaxID=31033 RepID=A0A3B5K4I7_TAKRU